MRPAAPGSRIGAGRLRVDAARAIAKLREYQLAERITWIAEAVRAAVASSATAVELDGDSNDVWLSWTGPAWDREVLPRLLDELVSPEPSRDAQHLRLLATAINSALGLEPAYIDVYAIAEDGSAHVVRYTPEILEVSEDQDAEPAIRKLACEPVDRPRRAPASGMHVHLRRRAGLETLGHFIRGGKAPELEIAEQMCRDLAVPIRIGRHDYGRDRFSGDLLRADLGGSLSGFLAIQDPRWATHEEPVAEMAERGVVITRYGLGTDLGAGRAPMPVRLFVDAPRMPTNASRSEVRRDAHPVKQAEQRARELTGPLCEQIAGELTAAETEPERRAALRDAVLAMLTAAAVGVDWPQNLRAIRGPLAILAQLDLVKNAVGEPRPAASRWTPSIIYHGREPLDQDLAPWVDDVLWVPPGDPSARLIERASIDPAGIKRRIKTGRKQLKRQRRFYRYKVRAPQVSPSRGGWIHATIGAPLPASSVADGYFTDLLGELALSRGSGLGEVTLLVDGRPLETIELISPVRFAAIAGHPELKPLPTYRSVHKNAAYNRTINGAIATAVRAIEAVAMAERGELPPEGYRLGRRRPDDVERVARLIRGGLVLARKLSSDSIEGPLVDVPAWPTVGGRWLTTRQVRELEVIGTAPFGAKLSIGREIILASPKDRELLEALAGDVSIVHYDPTLLPRTPDIADKLARDMASGHVAALAIREPTRRGAIAWGVRRSSIEVLHAGAPVRELGLEHELTHCVIAVDDDGIVPSPAWSSVSNPEILNNVASAFERQMAREVARAFAGFVVDDLVIHRSLALDRGAGLALCDAIVAAPVEPDELLGADVADALRTRPLFSALGLLEPVSAESIAAEFSGSIPVVMLPAMPVPGWSPLVVSSDVEARAIGRLLGRETHLATDELERRERTAARDRKVAVHRRKGVQPPMELPAGALEITSGPISGRMQISLVDKIQVTVQIEQRTFTVVSSDGPPISAVVDVPLEWADEEFEELDQYRRQQVLKAVRKRANKLLWSNLEGKPAALVEDRKVRSLALSMLRSGLLSDKNQSALRELPAFATVQGDHASVAEAELVGLARIASWGGEWLGPAAGDPEDPLDAPVLQISADVDRSLFELVDALAGEGAIDETHSLGKLQTSRAMKRGLLARPVVPGVHTEIKRELGSLGEAGRSLGEGEIGLVVDGARVLVHELGVLVGHIDVDVSPPVRVAVEDPGLVSMIGRQIRSGVLAIRVQRAVVALVTRLFDDGVALPLWAELAVGGALLAGKIAPELCGDRELFQTTALEQLGWQALVDQAERHGNVWYVTETTSLSPLDPTRFVLQLTPEAAALAKPPFPMIEATRELELDAEARANRARPAVDSLALPPEIVLSALEVMPLEGDGITAPRGHIAVLAPDIAGERRGLVAHRELKPLGRVDDPCDWPTYAVVDDLRLSADRTWSMPRRDEALGAVLRSVQQASERALGTLTPTPGDALASRPVWGFDAPRSKIVARGRIWLSSRWDTGTIAIECAAGEIVVHPTAVDGMPLPVSGKLLVYSPGHVELKSVVETLARSRYGELVRAALLLDRDPALIRAHVIVGLSSGLIAPEAAAEVVFDCFSPEPATAQSLATLLELDRGLPIVVERRRGDDLSIIDDGSLESQLLISMLGSESVAVEPIPEREPDGVANKPSFDEPEHPLNGLAQVIAARLDASGIRGFYLERVTVMASMKALLGYRSGTLYLGGASPELAAVEVARQSSSPWVEAAIDALVAHAIAELTEELIEVAPVDQMRILEMLLV